MELQYENVWAILEIDGSLQGEVEAAILPFPEIFTWIKNELAACQSLVGREDANVSEKCNVLSCSGQDVLQKGGNYFYASTVRSSAGVRYPMKTIENADFTVFFTRQQHYPYGQTGLVFSTNDLLLYLLRISRTVTLLRKWAANYTPDLSHILGNAFNWFYKTKVYDTSHFNIEELCADLLRKATADNYINVEKMLLTLKGEAFLSECKFNMPSFPQPPPSTGENIGSQNRGMSAKQTEKKWPELNGDIAAGKKERKPPKTTQAQRAESYGVDERTVRNWDGGKTPAPPGYDACADLATQKAAGKLFQATKGQRAHVRTLNRNDLRAPKGSPADPPDYTDPAAMAAWNEEQDRKKTGN